jgi:hypothetical protein
MPITYKVDREKNLIFETWTGTIRTGDLAAYWKQYLADAEVLAIRRTIVDLRGSVMDFSGAELWSLIESIVEPALKGREWTTALVVTGGSVEFGISRQYQVFAQRYSKDAIFPNVVEAEKWICS